MLRSLLFSPANSHRKVAKALAGDADAVIIDLEDAVALDEKRAARQDVIAVLANPRPKPVYVRVNGLSTPFCLDDLTLVGARAPDGIILPKVETARDLQIADWVLGQVEEAAGLRRNSIDLMPIIETARGIANVHLFAGTVERVRRMLFGAVDLALDMEADLESSDGPLQPARFAVAVASRAAGLESPIDTAFIDIGDLDRLQQSAATARRMGYQGKCCIHPAQVETVQKIFTPTAEEYARAEKIVAAFELAEAEGKAAIMVDGLMVDYPVAARARRQLANRPL